MLKILGKVSSINVRKVLWTCHEIGMPYVREDWGSGFAETTTPEFLAMNPNGLVPVLQVGQRFLWESNTICRYLANGYARTDLLPAAPWERALVERWMDWQATELNTAWRYAFLGLVRKDPGYADPEAIAASVSDWNTKIGILDRQLAATEAFAAGPAFTLADIVLGLSVHRWLLSPIARPDHPAVMAYYERLRQRPAFREHGSHGIP